MKEPKVDEGILKEIGRVIVAFGHLDFSLRCYLSGIINEKNDAVGDLIVMEFWTIDKCIDLLKHIAHVRAFSNYKDLEKILGRIKGDKFLRNFLVHGVVVPIGSPGTAKVPPDEVHLMEGFVKLQQLKYYPSPNKRPFSVKKKKDFSTLATRLETYSVELHKTFSAGKLLR